MKDSTARIIGIPVIAIFVIGFWVLSGIGFAHLIERKKPEPKKPPVCFIFPTVEHWNCNDIYVNGECPETCYLIGWITDNGVYHAAYAYSQEDVDGAISALKGEGE